jgi:beta-lactamase superfamily II metal-dependent hydrolase
MFNIHFLNVGRGDCTVIKHASGRLSIIDINNGQLLDEKSFLELRRHYQFTLLENVTGSVNESQRYQLLSEHGYDIQLTNPIEFLANNYPGQSLFRYIQTHPHLDHMRGLYDLYMSNISILNFWDIKHNFEPDLQNDSDRLNWNEYKQHRSGNRANTLLHLHQGDSGKFYNKERGACTDGDGIDILWPTKEYINSVYDLDDINPNNLSYVLRITYKRMKFILGGDAEEDVWKEIVYTYGSELKCDVLKASHHGRDSGYYKEAVELMNPKYTIVSVGKKPDSDASNKYRNYSDYVWSTRWRGNISFTYNGNGWSINSEYDR